MGRSDENEGTESREEEEREAKPMRVGEESEGKRKGRVGRRLRESRLVEGYD